MPRRDWSSEGVARKFAKQWAWHGYDYGTTDVSTIAKLIRRDRRHTMRMLDEVHKLLRVPSHEPQFAIWYRGAMAMHSAARKAVRNLDAKPKRRK